jgi:ParB family chromosome partitioning protein
MPTSPAPAKRNALGKGLESLLPARPGTIATVAATAEPVLRQAAGDRRRAHRPQPLPDPHQLRRRQARRARHLHRRLRRSPAHRRPQGRNGRYTLITGERRLLASKKAGKATIPSIVREVSNVQAMEMTIVENLQRADLNPMEQAHAYERLSRDFHMTQEQMAERTGKDRASVANFLRLLKLPESVQKHVEAGELTFGHARALLALESPEAILAATQKVLALNLSVRGTENYVQGLLNPENKPKAKPSRPPSIPTSAKPRTCSAAPSASRSPSRTSRAKAKSSSSTAASRTSTPSSPRSARHWHQHRHASVRRNLHHRRDLDLSGPSRAG